MNKEEILNKYIDLIDKGYCSDCNELNCIDNFPHAKITNAIRELQQENQKLKKQLEYLRSGEYYNQLRFENEMLQQVVDTNGVPIEVYDYIDCTHRNTELLEENQKYKEVINKANNLVRNYMDEWSINDEVWQKLNELLILFEEVE